MRTPPPLGWAALAALRQGLIWLALAAVVGAAHAWLVLDGGFFGQEPAIEPWLFGAAGLALAERIAVAALKIYRDIAARRARSDAWWESREAIEVLGRWRAPAERAASVRARRTQRAARPKRVEAKARRGKAQPGRKQSAKTERKRAVETTGKAGRAKTAKRASAAKSKSKTKSKTGGKTAAGGRSAAGASSKKQNSRSKARTKVIAKEITPRNTVKDADRVERVRPAKSKSKRKSRAKGQSSAPPPKKQAATPSTRHIQSDTHEDSIARGAAAASD